MVDSDTHKNAVHAFVPDDMALPLAGHDATNTSTYKVDVL